MTNLKKSLLEAETIPSETSSMSLFVPENINENDEYRPKYVPSYMPPFPAKHSYKKTPVSPIKYIYTFSLKKKVCFRLI